MSSIPSNAGQNNKNKLVNKMQQNMNTHGLNQNDLKKIVNNINQNINIQRLNNQDLNQLVNKIVNKCNNGNNFCNMGRNLNTQNIGEHFKMIHHEPLS
jgi:uncharacterized protein YpuA (DUF1002 family)